MAFNIDSDTVKRNVESTLSYYGGTNLTPNTGEKVGPNNSMIADGEDTLDGQKRIIFVTGDVDPWTELSFTAKGDKDHPSISVEGKYFFLSLDVSISYGFFLIVYTKLCVYQGPRITFGLIR